MVVVDDRKCVGCAMCFPFCPEGAIKVYGDAEIDPNKCIDCFLCVENCPNEALIVKESQ